MASWAWRSVSHANPNILTPLERVQPRRHGDTEKTGRNSEEKHSVFLRIPPCCLLGVSVPPWFSPLLPSVLLRGDGLAAELRVHLLLALVLLGAGLLGLLDRAL